MRFVIGAVALLVLGSIFGLLAGLLFWPDLSYATGAASRANMFLHTHRHHRSTFAVRSHPTSRHT
jgi:hypothetical protein